MESKKLFILFVSICCGVITQSSSQETENFEYPCESTDDWDCIRDFLSSNGQCEKASHEDGVPIETQDAYGYVPLLNASILCKRPEVSFYGSKILDFYLNKDTNNLVMTFDFDSLTLSTSQAYITFERVGKEPIVIEDYANITYSATITVVVAWSENVNPEDLQAYAFVKEPYPTFVFGPKILQSSNEIVQNTLAGLAANLPTAVQELWLTKAYFYSCVFLNNMLCDFGYLYDGRINRL